MMKQHRLAKFFFMMMILTSHSAFAWPSMHGIEMFFKAATVAKVAKPLNDLQHHKTTNPPPEKNSNIVTDKEYFAASAVKLFELCMGSGSSLANESFCNVKKHLFEDCTNATKSGLNVMQIASKCGDESGYPNLDLKVESIVEATSMPENIAVITEEGTTTGRTIKPKGSAKESDDDATGMYWLIAIGLCVLLLLIWDVRRLKRRN